MILKIFQRPCTYHYLKKMPSTHHFLATLYLKILLESHPAPTSWGCAKMKLIHEGGETLCPADFRSVALTSFVSKLFNKIIAIRLEEFFLESEIIDQSFQKGFLRSINGKIEHIYGLTSNCRECLT